MFPHPVPVPGHVIAQPGAGNKPWIVGIEPLPFLRETGGPAMGERDKSKFAGGVGDATLLPLQRRVGVSRRRLARGGHQRGFLPVRIGHQVEGFAFATMGGRSQEYHMPRSGKQWLESKEQ
ncbi:hypothetical protein IWX62_002515 [Arthrobacter sp. CAN_A1]